MALTALDLLILLQCVPRFWTKILLWTTDLSHVTDLRGLYIWFEATIHTCAGNGNINQSARPKTADHAVRPPSESMVAPWRSLPADPEVSPDASFVHLFHHSLSGLGAIGIDTQALSPVLAHHRKNAEPSPVGKAIAHEIHAPPLVDTHRRRQGTRVCDALSCPCILPIARRRCGGGPGFAAKSRLR